MTCYRVRVVLADPTGSVDEPGGDISGVGTQLRSTYSEIPSSCQTDGVIITRQFSSVVMDPPNLSQVSLSNDAIGQQGTIKRDTETAATNSNRNSLPLLPSRCLNPQFAL
ncbi:unnamed protein product [Cercopithifilaria johnstoni]|uniref:Uncharacterized protein n=1 Tax=Cercopithifilaria johnstoni TaxID=2874296 RepID=A0A8J2QBB3_9BILA|nr:unnamed protein product [Cercopithifilaria johnstoni]